MSISNLPPGCTQKMIDDAFGDPEIPICPNCGSDEIDDLNSYYLCRECGIDWIKEDD